MLRRYGTYFQRSLLESLGLLINPRSWWMLLQSRGQLSILGFAKLHKVVPSATPQSRKTYDSRLLACHKPRKVHRLAGSLDEAT